jgi:tyrosinase
MKCLHQELPNKDATVPGGRFRIDDFVAAHMRQGYKVEFTGLHLHWHRIFLHLYEKALQNECGYRGSLLYWDYSESALEVNSTLQDPVFFGDQSLSQTLGGNGERIVGNDTTIHVDYFGKSHAVPGSKSEAWLRSSDPVLGGFKVRIRLFEATPLRKLTPAPGLSRQAVGLERRQL